MNSLITKISAFLRRVGSSSPFISIEEAGTAFDAANFSSLSQGDLAIMFDNSDLQYYGSGYIKVLPRQGSSTSKYSIVNYPIKFNKSGKYKLYIRLKSPSSVFGFSVLLNDNIVSSHEVNCSNNWSWIYVDLVAQDNKNIILGIMPTSEGEIDSFYLTQNNLPDSILYSSSYITIHSKIYNLDSNNQPLDYLYIYDYKTTIEEIVSDNWYNFSTEFLKGYPSVDFDHTYAFAIFCSGSTSQRYLIWDYSADNIEFDPYFSLCSLTYDNENKIWNVDCNSRYAMRAYSSRNSLDEFASKIIVPASSLSSKSIFKFNTENINPVFINTKIEDIDENSNKVRLSLPDRLVSVIIDQSGSMAWNDSQGSRHEITERMINKLESTYPGNLKYNLLTFGGTPIKINFFAVAENNQINTNDTSSVASSFFADQESGYAGVRIIRKKGSQPISPLDGEIVAEGFMERAYDDELIEGERYYYSAYTFNSQGVFSEPRHLPIKTSPKIIPQGIGGSTSRIVIGSGVRRDYNTIGLWHLSESTGSIAYDFSDNPIQLKCSMDSLTWLNNSDVPSGLSGVRLNGRCCFFGQDVNKLVQNQYTFMMWCYPYNISDQRVLLSRETEDQNKITFKFGINTDGTLFYTMDEEVYANSLGMIDVNQWNHVAVTVDVSLSLVKFYINGSFVGSGSLSTLGSYSTEPMNIYIGGKSSSFFGKITEVSAHNIVRPDNYILKYSEYPVLPSKKNIDNGDRAVIINYVVPEDNNYSGGNIRIIRKSATGVAEYSYKTTVDKNGVPSNPQLVFEGFGQKPSHELDGDIIYEKEAEPGQYSIFLPYDYVHNLVYYFRIYSQNTLGNFSLPSDSPVLEISIPEFKNKNIRNSVIGSNFISPVKNAIVTAGNHKNYLKWDFDGIGADHVYVYWSDKNFPIINNSEGVDSSATLVFSGNIADTYFVDRNLENDVVSYYAIVAADRYGNFSVPVYVSAVPQSLSEESGIPLLQVKQFEYEIVNESAISLKWEAPVKFQKDISSWFDERVILYAQITDDLGIPIADASKMSFVASASVSSAELAEDVFGETVNRNSTLPKPEDCFILSSSVAGDGLIKGMIRMRSDVDILSSIRSISVEVKVLYNVPDKNNPNVNVFEFTSLPIRIEMLNPFKMEILNIGDDTSNFGSDTPSGVKRRSSRGNSSSNDLTSLNPQVTSGDFVKVLCKKNVPLDDISFIATGGESFNPNKFKSFDGCFVRRTRPFMARVVITYKGQSIAGGSCNVAVFEASDPQCDDDSEFDNPCGSSDSNSQLRSFVPSFSDRRSRSVQPPATSISIKTGFQRLSNGSTKKVSYVDIPLRAPQSPQSVMLFAKVSFNGYYSRRKLYIVFENILRIETTLDSPEPNCIGVAEQQARAYLIDPDSLDAENPIKIQIPDRQIIRWDLRKGRNSKDRPFYSTDNVSSGPGVFSLLRNGTTKNVYFGPACGVTWEIFSICPGNIIYVPEMYAIKASMVYDGLVAFEERPIIIYPPSFNSTGFGSRFLMQMPGYVNTIWADGYDFTKVTIYKDPEITGGFGSACFRQCANESGKPIFKLDDGQIVELESGSDFEVIYGENATVEYDNNFQEYVINNANSSIGFAQVPLSSNNATTVYLRINKFIGRSSQDSSVSESKTNICSCIDIPPGSDKKPNLFVVNGRTSINFEGETRYLRGGGDLRTGIPPTVVEIKEPLDIYIVDIRRNGERVNKLLCDGVSVHEFVIEVTFKSKPVPNGTPIFLKVGGLNPEKIILQSEIIYTEKVNDSLLNPVGNVRSLASILVAPFGPESRFNAQIQAEVRYDKRGDVERSISTCLTLSYDPSQPKEVLEVSEKPEGEINNVFSSSLEVYDSFLNTWETKSSMQNPRGCLTLSCNFDPYNEKLYAIGGLNGISIVSYNEMYDVATDKWTSKKSMILPRFYHMSSQYGNYIYVFGGITANGSSLEITNSVERYNTDTDEWENIGEMPSFDQNTYGIALGSIVNIFNKVYIIGGVRKIGQKGSIDSLNDRILVFDMESLEWSWSEKFTDNGLLLYERICPFAFVVEDTSVIHVTGGALPRNEIEDTSNQNLEFVTDSFRINSETLEIELDDYVYSEIPKPRYRGGAVSIGSDHFFLGGTSESSSVINLLEKVSELTPVYNYSKLASMPIGKSAFGNVSDNLRFIYVAGGLTSGRPPGFIQIKAKANPEFIRLDGKQSSTISLELINDVGERPSKSIRVLVQGILMFSASDLSPSTASGDDSSQQLSDSVTRSALIYPVIFSSNDFYINNGIGSTVLIPRSEDILQKISLIRNKLGISEDLGTSGNEGNLLKILEDEIRNPYSIKIRITIIDDFYYGQSILDIKDNEDIQQTVSSDTTTVTPTENTQVVENVNSFTNCQSIEGSQAVPPSGNANTVSKETLIIDQTLKENDNPVFDLNPPQVPQLQSPSVFCYSDIEWIPQINIHVNNGDYSNMIKYLDKIRNEIPFGGSPLYDAIVSGAEILLSDDLDIYSKSIYINSDNEENLSINTADSAIAEVQSIDGFGKTPVIINNFSIVFPLTLSALLSRTDTDSLDKIAIGTNGQSQTILDANYLNESLNNSLGKMTGSLGWGLYECIVDLGKNSIINNIKLDYELFSNTDGNWKVAVSEDGLNYSDYTESFNSNTSIEFANLNAQYLKFYVTLFSGLSASIENEYDLVPSPGVPALTGINIEYNIPKESFIYLNKENTIYSPQQISVSISANKPLLSSIEVGASTSNSFNWSQYYSGAQPLSDRHGKIVIPIRYSQNLSDYNEPLENVDGYMWKTKYGRWDSNAKIVIKTTDGVIVSSSLYKSYPDDGIIIFNSKQNDKMYISIENSAEVKLGIRVLNMDHNNPVSITGIGYMYNSNVFLPPPLSQRAPIVSQFNILPKEITVYSPISLNYIYFNINLKEEEKEKSEIRWYINGVEIEFLRNLRSWNNINDINDPIWIYAFSFKSSEIPSGTSIERYARERGESIIKVGDTLHATIRVSDGLLFSDTARSPSIKVIESPPFVTRLTIKGKRNDGLVQNNITSATRAFLDFDYFQDDKSSSKSQVIWYVNGIEFKRGFLNASVGGISNNEILVGEIKNNIVGISIGNVLEATIVPASENIIGNPITSSPVSVENDLPVIRNVIISPNPKVSSSSSLQLTYLYVDNESQQQGSTQNDQSSIRWLKSPRGSNEFAEVSALQNVRIVQSVNISAGEKWKAEVIPFDGLSVGLPVQSNTVEIV